LHIKAAALIIFSLLLSSLTDLNDSSLTEVVVLKDIVVEASWAGSLSGL
jgi:hypothetical protein